MGGDASAAAVSFAPPTPVHTRGILPASVAPTPEVRTTFQFTQQLSGIHARLIRREERAATRAAPVWREERALDRRASCPHRNRMNFQVKRTAPHRPRHLPLQSETFRSARSHPSSAPPSTSVRNLQVGRSHPSSEATFHFSQKPSGLSLGTRASCPLFLPPFQCTTGAGSRSHGLNIQDSGIPFAGRMPAFPGRAAARKTKNRIQRRRVPRSRARSMRVPHAGIKRQRPVIH